MSPINLAYFIDPHCHMFTIADIPLYQSVRQAVRNQTGFPKKILFPLLSFYLPVIDADDVVQKYEKFIRFFEHEPEGSAKQLVDEVMSLIVANGTPDFSFTAAKTLFTPLVMDFDCGGNVCKLTTQANRLVASVKGLQTDTFKVLPFMGIDPQRTDWQAFLDMAATVQDRGGFAEAKNGDFIGIKLYPSLGFNPQDFVPFYRKITEKKLPVTVHCQKGSLKLVDDADKFTDPKNWEQVLASMAGDANPLIINFAHFGGDDGVKNTIIFRERYDGEVGPPNMFSVCHKDTWTFRIIRMLKTYKNAYSDLSAFDYTSRQAVAALKWILHLDATGEFDIPGAPNYPIASKLLYGSDYPMTLKGGNLEYSEMFARFAEAMKRTKDINTYEYPPDAATFSSDAFIKQLVCDNPARFLGLM